MESETNRLYYDYAIPHIELISAMGFYGVDVYNGKVLTSNRPGDVALGTITGFVVFPNKDDQPKGARQYYTIHASLDNYDIDGNQVFSLTQTIKLDAIPPRVFDTEVLKVISNNDQYVTLESEDGQIFKINKRTDEVVINDADGQTTTLITNQSDYKDFIIDFLK